MTVENTNNMSRAEDVWNCFTIVHFTSFILSFIELNQSIKSANNNWKQMNKK